jgi:hypothetical protein
VPAGSEGLRALRATARDLERRTHTLVNAWRNRYYLTETKEEARVDIGKRAAGLAKDFETQLAEVRKAKLGGFEENVPARAAGELSEVLKQLKAAVALSVPQQRLLAMQRVKQRLQVAARVLDAEPCGRGLSQMAVDSRRGKVVLFGGCRLDSYLADTWVYHCKARKWEQRWPQVSPAPRAGHVLGWLPKSGRIVLFGSTNFDLNSPPRQVKNTPRDLWVYDIDANRWKRLPQSGKPPANGTGAVGPNDALVFLHRPGGRGRGPRMIWGLRVNAGVPDAGSAKAGVAPGTVQYISRGPDAFDRSAKIEPQKIDAFLKGLPPNRWTPMPRQGPHCNGHEWCASAYDAKRHQILFYGGGHSRWHYNDVSHYSLRTATWSTGYRDEYPYGPSSFKSPINGSFSSRPFFGAHIWDAVAYDPVADRMVICTRRIAWAYDPAAREWTYPPRTSVGEGLRVSMTETPHGAVQWHSGAINVFDGKTGSWRRLPLSGAKLGGAYGDKTGICYDSKRDCLWLSGGGSPMFRYDFKGGKLTRIVCTRAAQVFMRETVYVPELDMLLNVARNRAAGGGEGEGEGEGNLAFDIEAGKWVLLQLPYAQGTAHGRNRSHHVSHGLLFDPEYRVAIHHRNNWQVLVVRLEKKGLKVLDAPAAARKKSKSK